MRKVTRVLFLTAGIAQISGAFQQLVGAQYWCDVKHPILFFFFLATGVIALAGYENTKEA